MLTHDHAVKQTCVVSSGKHTPCEGRNCPLWRWALLGRCYTENMQKSSLSCRSTHSVEYCQLCDFRLGYCGGRP